MDGNGEHHANDAKPPAAARGMGHVSPFDRPQWFDLLAAHGFAGEGRIDAVGSAGEAAAWLPLRREKSGAVSGLANWYSFAIRPLYTGQGDHMAALRDLFARARAEAARLTLYPVPDAEKDSIATAMRAAGWWVRAVPAGDRHWLDLTGLDHDGWWATRPGALRSTVQRKAKKNIVAIEILTAFDADAWAAYEHIYAASWKPEEGNPALLRAFAEEESARGTFSHGAGADRRRSGGGAILDGGGRHRLHPQARAC